jgi:DNA-binding winged helix-turn-helix (wHTH) protein
MTSDPVGVQEPIRFGEDFELDVRPRRLRRGNHVVKLERIPLEILVLLIERRGEIVSREEIVVRVWGNDVFLDTDNSIRGAIRKVRQVLKDDPETPRIIQTVTGRGYRFIAPVISPEDGHPADVPRPEASTVPTGAQSLVSELDSWLQGPQAAPGGRRTRADSGTVARCRDRSWKGTSACPHVAFRRTGFAGSGVRSVTPRILGLATSFEPARRFPAQDSISCFAVRQFEPRS